MRDPSIETPARTIRDYYKDSKESQVTEKGTQSSAKENYRSPINHNRSHQKLAALPKGTRTQSVGLIDLKQPSRSSTPDKVYLQHRKEKEWKMKEARIAKTRIVASRTHVRGEQNLRPITSQELKGIFERYKNKIQETVIKVEDTSSVIAEKTIENEEPAQQDEQKSEEPENKENTQEEKETEKVEEVEGEAGEKEDEEIRRVETKYLEEEDEDKDGKP